MQYIILVIFLVGLYKENVDSCPKMESRSFDFRTIGTIQEKGLPYIKAKIL